LLGYRAAYAEDALVFHKGSVSSGGPNSDFVLYHGIRNSLFVLVKDVPARFLLRNLFWMLVLHVAILLRYTIKGKLGVVSRLYRDFLRGIPVMVISRFLARYSCYAPQAATDSAAATNPTERDRTAD